MENEQKYRVVAWWTSGQMGIAKSDSAPNAIHFTAPSQFGGLEGRWTPEDLLMNALASCFTTTFHAIASYSKFEYSNLKLSSPELEAGSPLTVDVDVKNASPRAGDEVVELYVSFPKVPGAPLRALRGCQRIHVDAGKLQHVKLTLQPRDLSYVNEAGNRMVGAGDYVITTGGGQPGTGAAYTDAKLIIRGEQKLPE